MEQRLVGLQYSVDFNSKGGAVITAQTSEPDFCDLLVRRHNHLPRYIQVKSEQDQSTLVTAF